MRSPTPWSSSRGKVWAADGDIVATCHGNAAHCATAEDNADYIAGLPDKVWELQRQIFLMGGPNEVVTTGKLLFYMKAKGWVVQRVNRRFIELRHPDLGDIEITLGQGLRRDDADRYLRNAIQSLAILGDEHDPMILLDKVRRLSEPD